MAQRIAYVTGGMGGIGTAICQRLYKENFTGRAGQGSASPELFRDADQAILHCRTNGLETGVWKLNEDAHVLIGKVLALFDQQLAVVSVHELATANEKLKKIFSARETGG